MKTLPILLRRSPNEKLKTITGAGIKASYGNNYIMWLSIDSGKRGIELRADRRVIVAILKQLLARLDNVAPAAAANQLPLAGQKTAATWDWLTPQMVIDKFAASPNLRPMLSDVEAVLKPQVQIANAANDLQIVKDTIDPADLFTEQGTPARGAQTKIAAALGIKNAGSYRPRIKAVLATLQHAA